MGCFDTLDTTCPLCGRPVSVQSKAGKCNLRRYTIANAPLSILADVQEGFECPSCGVKLGLEIQRMVSVVRYVDCDYPVGSDD